MSENNKKAKESGIIQVRSPKADREVEFDKSFGDNLQESSELYGEDVVYSIFYAQAVIKCQAKVRQVMDKGGSNDEAISAGQSFTPGVITRTKIALDPIEQLASQLASGEISKDDLREKLEARLAQLGAATDLS